MSTFRELVKSYRSNLKLTPNDKEPLELFTSEATTRKLTKEYKLDGRIFEDTRESRAFLDLESKMLEVLEYELVEGSNSISPELVNVYLKGEVRI